MNKKRLLAIIMTVMLIVGLFPFATAEGGMAAMDTEESGDGGKGTETGERSAQKNQKLKIKVVDLQPTYVSLKTPFTLSGRLLDENNDPVRNTSLRVWYQKVPTSSNVHIVGDTTTDADGRFSMDITESLPESEEQRNISIQVFEDTTHEGLHYYSSITFSNKTQTWIDDRYLKLKPIYPNETFTGDLVVVGSNTISFSDVADKVFLQKQGTNVGSTSVTEGGTEVKIEVTGSELGEGKHVLTFGYSGNDTFASCSYDFVLEVLPGDRTVTVTAAPQEGGKVTGGGTVAYGSSVTVTATANTGYVFMGWYDGAVCVSLDEKYTISKLEDDIKLTAKFQKVYTVTLNMDGGTIQDPLSSAMVETVSLDFPEGYRIIQWLEESANTTAPANSIYNGTEITDKNGTKTYAPRAEYKVESAATVKVLWKATAYTVTYFVANGTWADGTSTPKTEVVADGESPKQIPSGMVASEGFEGGAWNPDPNGATIGDNTSFTYTFTAKPAENHTYKMVSGSGGTYVKESGKTLSFTFKRSADDDTTYSHFTGIEVDGKAVPEKDASGNTNWKAKSGSVIIELQPSYLDTLSVGEHKLAAKFDDGADVTATFTVKAKAATVAKTSTAASGKATTTAPKTGDESTPGLWLATMLSSALFLMLLAYDRRKRRIIK